uniref:ethanolamine kinase n=2 Tax=Ditylum brightwellii TaxID=49249 RepID=A0A7S4RCL9_9STRA
MAPSDFINTRETAISSSPPSLTFSAIVDNRPYYPNLFVNVKDESTIRYAAAVIVAGIQNEKLSEKEEESLNVSVVSGGITNALFRVSGVSKLGGGDDDVLVRVFGAEGMIDRDVETSTFAALASASIAPPYYGRFSNGRIEGFLPNYSTLSTPQLSDPAISNQIASSLAKLHCEFSVPSYLSSFHNASKPGMWDQLHSWLDQALSITKFKTEEDDNRASLLQIDQFKDELRFLEKEVVPSDAAVVFCHNDLLAGNIMVGGGDKNGESTIQFVDFEYGGINYVSFDIANHFNEFAGGTADGVPDYSLFPDEERRREFIAVYISTSRAGATDKAKTGSNNEHACDNAAEEEKKLTEEEEIQMLLSEVDAFVMANHLYWGMWGVNQAAAEGCDEFDYLLYAKNRFAQYFVCKEEALKKIKNNS